VTTVTHDLYAHLRDLEAAVLEIRPQARSLGLEQPTHVCVVHTKRGDHLAVYDADATSEVVEDVVREGISKEVLRRVGDQHGAVARR